MIAVKHRPPFYIHTQLSALDQIYPWQLMETVHKFDKVANKTLVAFANLRGNKAAASFTGVLCEF